MSETLAVQNHFTDDASGSEERLFAQMGHYLAREIQQLLGNQSQGSFIVTLKHTVEKETETWDPLLYKQTIRFTIDKWGE